MAFKIGDAAKIKQGVKDSEYGKWDLSGWQGWITQKPSKDDPLYELVWDTETLKNMPNDFIVAGNIDEVDWVFYATGDDELESKSRTFGSERESPLWGLHRRWIFSALAVF